MSYYYNSLPPLTVPGVPALFNPFTQGLPPWLLPQGNPTQAVAETFFSSSGQQSNEVPPPLLDLSARLLEVNPNSFAEAAGDGPEIPTQQVPNELAATKDKVDQAARAIIGIGQNNPEKTTLTKAQNAKQGAAQQANNPKAFRTRENEKKERRNAYYRERLAEDSGAFRTSEKARNKAYKKRKLAEDPKAFRARQAASDKAYKKRKLAEDPEAFRARKAASAREFRKRQKEKSLAAELLLSLAKQGEEKAPV